MTETPTETSFDTPTRFRRVHRGIEPSEPTPRRSPWRQRLVDVERGFVSGLRSDGSLHVLLFGACVVASGGLVLGLSLGQWAVVTLAITGVLVAGLLNQVLKAVWRSVGHHFDTDAERLVRTISAAVYVTVLGSGLSVLFVFAARLRELFAA